MTNRFPEGWPDEATKKPYGKPVNLLALVKNDGERYIFLYDDQSARAMIEELMGQSEDPELSLTPYDAAVLSQKVRKLLEQEREEQRRDEEFGEGLE